MIKDCQTGERILHRSGHPYLIVHKTDLCTFVIDLFVNTDANKLMAILPRDYDDFLPEHNMEAVERRVDGESYLSWKYTNTYDRLQGEAAWI